MSADNSSLSPTTTAFGVAASIVVVFNTILACAKDASAPLKSFLASLSNHDWTTQGILDVILFFGLGYLFLKMGLGEKVNPNRAIIILAAATVLAGVGLFAWYAFF